MSNKTGWKCPECERVYAPHIDECKVCNEGAVQKLQLPQIWSDWSDPSAWRWTPLPWWEVPTITRSFSYPGTIVTTDTKHTPLNEAGSQEDLFLEVVPGVLVEYTRRIIRGIAQTES